MKKQTENTQAAPKAAQPKTTVKKALRHVDGKAAAVTTHGYHALDNFMYANMGKAVSVAELANHVRDVLCKAFGATGDVLAAAENAVVHQLPIDAGFGRKTSRVSLTIGVADAAGKIKQAAYVAKKRPARAELLAGRVTMPVGTKPRAYRISLADGVSQRPFGKAAE